MISVQKQDAPFEDILVLKQQMFTDHRGVFREVWRSNEVETPIFLQTSMSSSGPFTIRGLHYQTTKPQGKLVTVAQGSIFDVAVDMRKDSPSFGRWWGRFLEDKKAESVYIPPGYAHGFMTLGRGATVVYQCTSYHNTETDRSVRWNDEHIGIPWPPHSNMSLILSKKDREAPFLLDAEPIIL